MIQQSRLFIANLVASAYPDIASAAFKRKFRANLSAVVVPSFRGYSHWRPLSVFGTAAIGIKPQTPAFGHIYFSTNRSHRLLSKTSSKHFAGYSLV